MRCPYKFGLYDFEGGEDCIGAECGMHKLCGANDILAAENDVSEASVDANDSREKLEEYIRWRFPVLEELVIKCIDRQAAITERELCKQCSWPSLAAMPDKEAYDRIAKLQKQVDDLTAELTAARNAHAQAEHEAVILREKLGRMLDNAHEITRIGGDC